MVDKDGRGAVTIDRSRTSVGNYLRYGIFGKSARSRSSGRRS
jgi:hypothetical protein